jgi:hypothetical protein
MRRQKRGRASATRRGSRTLIGGMATAELAAAALVLGVPAADAHITGDPIGITHDLFTAGGGHAECVYANGNCSVHSFTFASANDTANTGSFCAEIYDTGYPPRIQHLVRSACSAGSGIARVCLNNGHDGGGPLHCVDQDKTMFKAGAYNAHPLGTTIRRHVIY